MKAGLYPCLLRVTILKRFTICFKRLAVSPRLLPPVCREFADPGVTAVTSARAHYHSFIQDYRGYF